MFRLSPKAQINTAVNNKEKANFKICNQIQYAIRLQKYKVLKQFKRTRNLIYFKSTY